MTTTAINSTYVFPLPHIKKLSDHISLFLLTHSYYRLVCLFVNNLLFPEEHIMIFPGYRKYPNVSLQLVILGILHVSELGEIFFGFMCLKVLPQNRSSHNNLKDWMLTGLSNTTDCMQCKALFLVIQDMVATWGMHRWVHLKVPCEV